MTRVLFITSGLTHGGVNKALLNLINLIDNEKYSFDIFPIYREGPYRELFGKYSIIPVDKILPALFPFNIIFRGRLRHAETDCMLFDSLTRMAIHLFPKTYAKRIDRLLSPGEYDVVVSFQEGYTTEFATYIKARRHITWVHCDYSRYIEARKKDESKIYNKFDSIIAVSEYTASVLKRHIPTAAGKVVAIHNFIDQNGITELSNEETADERFTDSPFKLISIGRMDPVKRFSLIPGMAKKLKAKGIPFKWYIIGDGGAEKSKVEDAIKENQVEDEVILLGAKNNPYPYIKSSSVLVCPSSSEACPNVVNEGRILYIPVIAADFPSAGEFIVSGQNGFISPVDGIPEVLEKLYTDKTLYNTIIGNIQDFRYDNESNMRRIKAIFG